MNSEIGVEFNKIYCVIITKTPQFCAVWMESKIFNYV